MHALRYLTLAWPGLPWAWLRGSVSGLVLALAFAVSIDMALVTTFIWPGLVELPLTVGLWTAVAVLWLVSAVSAAASFPPPLAAARSAETDELFVRARDAYLARDWLQAEARIRDLLKAAPTDGEAQLLHATLMRRTSRPNEARRALEQLARSDSGAAWGHEIAVELRRLAAPAAADDEGQSPAVLPLRDESREGDERVAA
jgi:hypothetical protein